MSWTAEFRDASAYTTRLAPVRKSTVCTSESSCSLTRSGMPRATARVPPSGCRANATIPLVAGVAHWTTTSPGSVAATSRSAAYPSRIFSVTIFSRASRAAHPLPNDFMRS
ncbi:hypothetical protein [Nonomuraea sp. NPDC005501]|uniref:hypothetical protein n=1 Tax=Nonomuraea sp. NPDC005501 TaxID=3156884 RepID=UPI0033ABCECF